MEKKLINCTGEWPFVAIETTNTQAITGFSWGLNLWISLIFPERKILKEFPDDEMEGKREVLK